LPDNSAPVRQSWLDRWAGTIVSQGSNDTLAELLADIGRAIHAQTLLILQPESAHEAERTVTAVLSESACNSGDVLLDVARRVGDAPIMAPVAAPGDGPPCTVLALPLRAEQESVGVLAALFAPGIAVDPASLERGVARMLASTLYVLREASRNHALVAQYERGFQTLDRQVRVLDLERQKLAAVLNNAEIGFLVLDHDLKVTWANPAMALNLNASGSGFGLLRQRCNEVVCGQDEPCAGCPARGAHEDGRARRTEIASTHPESPRRMYTIAVPIRGSSGDVQEVLLMVQDLTDIDALRQSEERYRLLFESSMDAIFMAAPPDFRIVMANPATLSLLGYDDRQLEDLTLADIHAPDDWRRMQAHYHRAAGGDTLQSEDCMILDRHGKTLCCNVIAMPFELGDRRVVMCNLRDITARKQTEEDLARSYSLLRGTLESTTDGILVVDHEGRISSYNQKFLQMWRLPDRVAESGDDRQALEWALPQLQDPDAYMTKVRELYAQPEAESYDLIKLKDGRTFERYSQPHRIADTSVGRVWSFRDITERTRAEESLQYRLRFENLISTLSTHFINLSIEEIDQGIQDALRAIGEFASVDRSYIFLFSPDESRFSNAHEWYAAGIVPQMERAQDVPVDVFPWFMEQIRRHEVVYIPRVADLPDLAEAEREEFTAQNIQSLICVPMVYGKSLLGFLGFDSVRAEKRWAEDVVSLLHIASELLSNALMRKRAESEKSSLEEQLRQSQKMEAVGTLAGGIAHDFNNLLTGILGYADMLNSGGLSPEQTRKAADVIEKAARRAAELTQQLLGFARKGKYQNIPVDLHAIIAEVVSLLGRTIDKNVSLHQDLKADEPFVLGDPVQIQQVILNLSVNARDAMAGGGRLSFETERIRMPRPVDARGGPAEDNQSIKLVVSDTGCGIPLEVQPRIFEPFFTTKEQGKGTGMGLSMVYGIVKNHGGSICVTSDADRGTRFEIFLPAVARPELVVEDNEESRAGTGGATILLVDDEELVRNVASTMLETLGYRVMTAHDGADAVELYRRQEHQIDLVILDMAMPRLGGRDCFRAMCEINPAVRAVLSTGYTLDDTTQSILDEGMVGFAQKPYVMDELADTVSRALEGPSSRGLRPPVTPRRIVSRKP